jgi:hypothetical protein
VCRQKTGPSVQSKSSGGTSSDHFAESSHRDIGGQADPSLISRGTTPPHLAMRSRPEFAGSSFETLDGGGGKSPDMFTAADLLAVEMLSVQVPALVTIALLEGDLGIEMTGFLREIPKSMEIHDSSGQGSSGRG